MRAVVDERALRLEQIRSDRETNERIVDLQARRHVAVLAVGMTTGAGASAAEVLGQVPTSPAMAVATPSAMLVLSQVRSFGVLQRPLERGRQEARLAIERLIEAEVQSDDDAAEAEP